MVSVGVATGVLTVSKFKVARGVHLKVSVNALVCGINVMPVPKQMVLSAPSSRRMVSIKAMVPDKDAIQP